jgi:peptidyl-prolyl cis-trans isomerase B (cyclophilin B)
MMRVMAVVGLVSVCLAALSAGFAMADDQADADDQSKPKTKTETDAKPKIPDLVYVNLSTTRGDVFIELDQQKAPVTVKNFLDYADSGFYDGTIFHRVIRNFMIQGGGFDKDLNPKETRPGIKNEWKNGLKNKRGTIAMARLRGKPDSATSEFFINVKDNPPLNTSTYDAAGYVVFGKVIQGMDVVDMIKAVRTRRVSAIHRNVPLEPIIINKVTRVDPGQLADPIAAARAAEAAETKVAEVSASLDNLYATISTSKGDIRLQLFPSGAPLTVANFVNLAQRGYYDGLKFHRVIANFMIQGGDPTGTGLGGPGYQFKNECSPKFRHDGPGILSMANSGPGTNGSQFFITHKATPHLNDKHTIFGKVVAGQDVVNAVAKDDAMNTIKIEGDTKQLFEKQKDQLDKWNKTLDEKFPRKP